MNIRIAQCCILSIALFALLLPASCLAQDDGGDVQQAVVTASTLNLRASPSASADIVAKLKKGDQVTVLGEEGEWLRVRTAENTIGWLSAKYVSRRTVTQQEPVVTRTVIRNERPSRVGTGLDGGLIAGLVFSSFSGDDAIDGFSSRMAYTAGLVVTAYLSPIIGVQGQIMYVMKGAVYEGLGMQTTYEFDYLELPVMLRLSADIGMPVVPYAMAGGYISYRLQAVRKSDAPGATAEDMTNIRKMDYGIALGGGVRWRLGNYILLLNVRYGISLQDVQETPANPLDVLDLRQRSLSIELGVIW